MDEAAREYLGGDPRSHDSVADEPIGAALVAEGRCGTVSRDEAHVVAERPELRADRVKQRRVIPSRKIGPADRALEEHIAYERDAVGPTEEYDVPGRMTGTVEHLELGFADAHAIAVLEPAVRLKSFDLIEAESMTLGNELLDPEAVFALRPLHGYVQPFGQGRSTTAMIDMAMREQDLLDLHAELGDCAFDAIEVASRIHDRGALRCFAYRDRTVLLKRRDRNDCESHGSAKGPEGEPS